MVDEVGLTVLDSDYWHLVIVALDDNAVEHGEIETATKTVIYS
jgi:hypothetical protein